jgi:hypothetical protein
VIPTVARLFMPDIADTSAGEARLEAEAGHSA